MDRFGIVKKRIFNANASIYYVYCMYVYVCVYGIRICVYTNKNVSMYICT